MFSLLCAVNVQVSSGRGTSPGMTPRPRTPTPSNFGAQRQSEFDTERPSSSADKREFDFKQPIRGPSPFPSFLNPTLPSFNTLNPFGSNASQQQPTYQPIEGSFKASGKTVVITGGSQVRLSGVSCINLF